MKKAILVTALFGMAVSACTKEIKENGRVYTYEFSLSADGATKTLLGDTCVEWEVGDRIGTYVFPETMPDDAAVRNAESAVNASVSPVTFTFRTSSPLRAGQKVCCTSPYRNVDAERYIPIEIPSAQTVDASGDFDCDAMPMVSVPITVESEVAADADIHYNAGEVRMLCLGSIIEFRIYTSAYGSERVKSVTFAAEDNIASSYIPIDAYMIDPADDSTLEYDTAGGTKTVCTSLDLPAVPGTSKENFLKVDMVVAAGIHAGNVIVRTDQAYYTYSLSSREFRRASVKPLNINLTEEKRTDEGSVFVKVTSEGAFEDGGKYILALEDASTSDYYFIKCAGSTGNLAKNGLSVVHDVISNPDGDYVFTAHADSGAFKFTSEKNDAMFVRRSGTNVNTAAEYNVEYADSYLWTPVFQGVSGSYFIGNQSYYLSYGSTATTVKAYNRLPNDQLISGMAINTYDGAVSVFRKL